MKWLLVAAIFAMPLIARGQMIGPDEDRAPVSGIPFTAQVVSSAVRVLNDGTKIVHHAEWIVARDSQGRTRSQLFEQHTFGTNLAGVADNVNLYDPVKSQSTFLSFSRKTASVLTWPALTAQQLAHSRTRQPYPPAACPVTKHSELGGKMEVTSECLGKRTIAGVPATGGRTTRELATGFDGNDRPIAMVTEYWRSSKLGITLLVKSHSPIDGDSTQELTNIHFAEPDPALFKIPEGYTVKEEKAR